MSKQTKDSTPVTFADVLRYHRRLAADPRADRAWHAGAVECLVEFDSVPGIPVEFDSVPGLFASALAYHRRMAAAGGRRRVWHAEVADCLREMGLYWGTYFCQSCGAEYDKYGCTREKCGFWQARKAVEGEG